MDLSQLSDADLDALSKNDVKSVSDHGLDVIAGQAAPKAAVVPQVGKASSAVAGAIQGSTLGFGDEISGGLEAAGRAIGIKGAGGGIDTMENDPRGATLDFDKLKAAYLKGRDDARSSNDTAQAANPISYGAGNFVGSIPAMAAAPVPLPVVGAIQGLGDSNADLNKGQVSQAAQDTGKGALYAYLAGKAAPVVGKGLSAIGGAASDATNWAAQKVGKIGAGIPEEVTQRYLANPDAVRNALPIDDIAEGVLSTGENAGPIQQLKDHVSSLSSKAWDTLSTDPQIPKDDVLSIGQDLIADITGGKNGQLNRTAGVGASADKITAINKYLDQIQGAYGDQLSETDLKSVVKDLQDVAYGMEGNPKYTQQAEGIRQLSGIYNDTLKQGNPAYASAMEPVQEATQNLQSMQKAFVNKQDPDSADKAINAIKSWNRKSDASSIKQAVDYTDQNLGTGLADDIQASQDKAQFNKTDTQGSKKTVFGSVIGGAVGYMAGGPIGAAAGAGAGSAVGQAADKYAGKAFQKALDTGIGISNFTSKLGPYAKPLMDAAQRGTQALAAAHFVLQQRDPKYRERINSITDGDKEQGN